MSRPAHIALYGGGGSPYHHAAVLAAAGHQIDFVFPVDILSGALRGFDVFVMPGGGIRAMIGQLDPLGSEGARGIAQYVRDGGMYLGSCAGSYCAARTPDSFLARCPVQRDMQLLDTEIWNAGTETEDEGLLSPGVGVIRVRNTLPAHPVMRGMPEHFTMTHYNGPLFRTGDALSRVEGATDRFTPGERFLGPHDGETLLQRAAADGVANTVVGSSGNGRVVLFGSHPEFGSSLTMDDLPDTVRMLSNAIEWQLTESPSERPKITLTADTLPVREGESERAAALARQIRRRAEALPTIIPQPSWLGNMYAMSVFGLSPADIWHQGVDEICRLAREVEAAVPDVAPRVLGFHQAAAWNTDIGYHGIVSLLELADALLARAQKNWSIELGPPSAEPYAHIDSNPYHLVVGSYLSAMGLMTGAAVLCRLSQGVLA